MIKLIFISCIQSLHLSLLAEEILINVYVQRSKKYTKDEKYITGLRKNILQKLFNYKIIKGIKEYPVFA